MTTSLSRRTVLAASAATLAAGSALAAPAAATPVAGLWAQAEKARLALRAHAGELNAVDALGGGLPGWMRASGAANTLGHQRYQALVALLNEKPRSADDLAIMAKAAHAPEIVAGPKSWAAQRLASARMMLAA